MSDYRAALRSTLRSERKAYGFTLVIWGGATMTAGVRGTATGLDGIAYVGGAFTAMAIVILVTLNVTIPSERPEPDRLSLGTVHFLSVAGGVGGAWVAAELCRPPWLAYLVAGAAATIIYQLAVAFESIIADDSG